MIEQAWSLIAGAPRDGTLIELWFPTAERLWRQQTGAYDSVQRYPLAMSFIFVGAAERALGRRWYTTNRPTHFRLLSQGPS